MPDHNLFEYAVIRVVPKVEREEFLNVGVILFSKQKKFLKAIFMLNREKLLAFNNQLDITEIEDYLRSFERICNGTNDAGPIGKLDMASRFRWLTATRSTILQTSKVHPGFCEDPQDALNKLYTELVL
ncbi:DUF3037 domain-containing protein [Flavihumibacter profundi]|jgi:hypothetical protein|uniref:DUF3037 domain-containing protein n=1 Tax=Flavihumibacter profundi TaxID=2716883 RepID=UPI001CC3CC52|nr:DUF3037 domain-containing protein [Flavihumibacter profundi]MBZ5855669.1 DUF3037 domain-containing protein [Flavihumibacter profundi]